MGLIPLIPALFALVLLFGSKKIGRASGWIATAALAGSFAAAVAVFSKLLSLDPEHRAIVLSGWDWVSTGALRIGVDLRFDQLSGMMCVMVTGVATLIHLYSIGYMKDDPNSGRFFAYLNLFVASMLLLVLADNLLMLFVGWEGVGLCSYLLIGFWSHKPSAATAAKKAFLTTRIGDTGFMIGLFVLFAAVGTLDIPHILNAAAGGEIARSTATLAALLLLCGAIGKSAQFPLYVWLPDAMEGPSPVSALIHAATMVTAGVYLVVRMSPLFELSGTALTVTAIIGVSTALFAALLATAEEDIKKVLAYSTISQLGFMFLAAGVGAYSAAMFHLITHAFFKALLFLAAGSVMHGLHDETSMERMGGLRKAMKATFAVTFVGWAAITGILPFAGFFSKDAIMASVLGSGHTGLFWLGVVAAVLTAFYMSRLLFLTFFGKPRWSEGVHPHESGLIMVAPMIVLAVAAVFAGVLDLPSYLPNSETLTRFLEPVVGHGPGHAEGFFVPAILFGLSVVAMLVAGALYISDLTRRERMRSRLGPVYTLIDNRFYVDEIYASLIVAPARLAATFFAYVIDTRVIDGVVNGVGSVVSGAAGAGRKSQSGLVRQYALGILVGAAVLIAFFTYRSAA